MGAEPHEGQRAGAAMSARTVTSYGDGWAVEMEPLDVAACWRLLTGAATRIGRLGFVYDNVPMILPVNFAVVDHSILVRTAFGTLVHATVSLDRVAFEVDHSDETRLTGWSVLVAGRSREVEEPDGLLPDAEFHLHTWAPGKRDSWIRIESHSISGRLIRRRRTSHPDGPLPYMTPD